MNQIEGLGDSSPAKVWDDDFWRDRCCELLGLKPGADNATIFDAAKKHTDWRTRTAAVLGLSHKSSSANLLAEHDKYLQGMKRVNQTAPAIQNQRARIEMASSLVNVLVKRGLDYRAACGAVRRCYPALLSAK